MEKNISYLSRTYTDYKDALIEMSQKYYPDLSDSYDDASVGAWLIDLAAAIADNESYHIDRVYQETNVDSAQEKGSLMAIARNNGVKIPGPKGAMAEMKLTIVLDAEDNEPDWSTAPTIKRGTKFSAGSQIFELLSDVDFQKQFDENGNSDRTIIPNVNTNGIVTGYTVSKLSVVTAGETRVYRKRIYTSDVTPFMEVVIPTENVMNIESILVCEGDENGAIPTTGDFYSDGCTREGNRNTRFYEVENLAETKTWSDAVAKKREYKDVNGNVMYYVTKGEWITTTNKFITEYTDKGYLKVIFGAGDGNDNVELGNTMESFSKWQISKILNNNNLGVLPKPNTNMFILYRVGGGKVSNVAKGAINRVTNLNADFPSSTPSEIISKIIKSLRVENTTPSVSGKDMPSEKELRYYIKYHNAAQRRCVTIKDYIDRLLQLPPKYGTPFRVGAMEENNKIMIYLLGIDNDGHLDTLLPLTLIQNIEDYLNEFRCINDYVEIKAGRIINLSFDINVIIDKNYNKGDVISTIINTVESYMDINKHMMGEEIYIGDLEKEISKIDGVINLIGLEIHNETGTTYSQQSIEQETIESEYGDDTSSKRIDLDATDGILYNDGDTMMEIKYPSTDIRVRCKLR